jgi:hypothetical protein
MQDTKPFPARLCLHRAPRALQLVSSNWRSTASCSSCAILCVVVLSCTRCCNEHGADNGLQPLVQSAQTYAPLSTFQVSEELSSRRPGYGHTACVCAGGAAAATGAAGTVAVLVCAESFLTGLYCIASFPTATSTCGPGQHDAADNTLKSTTLCTLLLPTSGPTRSIYKLAKNEGVQDLRRYEHTAEQYDEALQDSDPRSGRSLLKTLPKRDHNYWR